MAEKVRLIIWDLDETFWRGTLTEGGIQIRPELCELVKTLAARGIMSSICSKNDFNDVRAVLERAGVWDYFVFPSINWEPKGPRVAALVETVQLRAPTVMFIDDNPLNLEEVRHFMPDIQVQGHEFVSEIAGHPLYQGKDDSSLSRLQQYKLMETRKKDEVAAGTDVSAFLRSSQIKVVFERDLESHIDRVIELINRTNQLNFTKVRLPEEPEEARRRALELLGRYNIQAALLRVSDRYGDHGFCGLYIMDCEDNRLLHYCFSCRILGMGVEQWIYGMLGGPKIDIVGEVLSDPSDVRHVDWINQETADAPADERVEMTITRMVAHGGCDLAAISHYFTLHGLTIISEFNLIRNGMPLRTDHSVFLRYALHGVTDSQLQAAQKLEFSEEDFRSELFSRDAPPQCVLLSLATDAHYGTYRHRETGLTVPLYLKLGPARSDQRQQSLPEGASGLSVQLQQFLKDDFDFCGLTTEQEFKDTLHATLTAIDPFATIIVLLPCEYYLNKENGYKHPATDFINLNCWTRDVAADFGNVTLLSIPDFVHHPDDVNDILHYNRRVYFRIYEYILNLFRLPTSSQAKAHLVSA